METKCLVSARSKELLQITESHNKQSNKMLFSF